MSAFDQCFEIVLGAEGGFTGDPADPGNWTSGIKDQGVCRGTKFGISAAAYPGLDIAALTLAQAKAIYRQDYWDKISGDQLPPALALLTFDSAVNSGTHWASVWLQEAAGITVDGVIGPVTLHAILQLSGSPHGKSALCAEFLTRRLLFMLNLPAWSDFGFGWVRRIFRLQYQALSLAP